MCFFVMPTVNKLQVFQRSSLDYKRIRGTFERFVNVYTRPIDMF